MDKWISSADTNVKGVNAYYDKEKRAISNTPSHRGLRHFNSMYVCILCK